MTKSESTTTRQENRVGKGEFHPQTSHRTVREPLDSYGSTRKDTGLWLLVMAEIHVPNDRTLLDNFC